MMKPRALGGREGRRAGEKVAVTQFLCLVGGWPEAFVAPMILWMLCGRGPYDWLPPPPFVISTQCI